MEGYKYIENECRGIEVAANNYEKINKVLNSTGYDFFDYSDDIAILVDNQRLSKEGLPVFEKESEYGDVSNLVGKLLFVRNVETEFSTSIRSIHTKIFLN